MKSIKEIKDFINENGNSEGCLENFIDEHYEEFKNIDFRYLETLETDEHRWYILSTIVYEVFKDNMALGYLAINEVTTLKSESTSYSDLFIDVTAYEVKKIVKESFEILKGK